MPLRHRGIEELFRDDPERADRLIRGWESDPVSRRSFLKSSGAAISAVIGRSIPYARWAPAGLVPVALAEIPAETEIGRKDGLVILNDRPVNAETPAHLLDDPVTPANRLFVRNNGIPPDIPVLHGAPLRLVIGGWPGSVSGKWLKRIVVRNKIHDGPKMTGYSYRVPCSPVPPGATVPEDQMRIIQSMPVKSLITRPRSGVEHDAKETLAVRGHAWAGDSAVSAVRVSIDFGATWEPAKLEPPANRLAWQRWIAAVRFPRPGYYEIWARATDDTGRSQPMLVPGWNPKGYLNNACHRIAVLAV